MSMNTKPAWAAWIVALVLPASATSCISNQRYPETWPAVVAVEKEVCPQLSGTYLASGEVPAKAPDDRKAVLPELFFEPRSGTGVEGEAFHNHSDALSEPHCDLSLTAPRLYVSCWRTERSPRVRMIPNSGFACGKRGLRFDIRSEFDAGAGSPVGGGTYVTATLARDHDGALIVRQRETESFIFFIFPFYFTSSEWLRFPVIDAPTQRLAAQTGSEVRSSPRSGADRK